MARLEVGNRAETLRRQGGDLRRRIGKSLKLLAETCLRRRGDTMCKSLKSLRRHCGDRTPPYGGNFGLPPSRCFGQSYGSITHAR